LVRALSSIATRAPASASPSRDRPALVNAVMMVSRSTHVYVDVPFAVRGWSSSRPVCCNAPSSRVDEQFERIIFRETGVRTTRLSGHARGRPFAVVRCAVVKGFVELGRVFCSPAA
jgi:hypothetical protein